MIFITGDTHADWRSRLRTKAFIEQKKMAKDDYVIICGDFGIWDNSKEENNNLDWLENKSFTTLFVDGNHENYDILDSLAVSEWNGGKVHKIRPSVLHLMRGEIFTIEGKKFFTFGGASSHDIEDGILEVGDPRIKLWRRDEYKLFRVNHVSWWERELPSQEEIDYGLDNLNRNGNKVDYIITHSPYASVLVQMVGNNKQDVLTRYLQKIKETAEYKHWIFGHMHSNKSFAFDKSSCIYEQIVRIV